ncbi:MAG: hypothetical protein RR463_08240 [Hydrogenoanaerobacterium sp.]
MKKISLPIIITSVALVVSLTGNGYLLYDRQITAKATLLSGNTYQAEIDKLSAKVQEQTDLVSKQSKLIDELKCDRNKQREELSEANSLVDRLLSIESLKSSDNGDGLVTLEPLDTTGVPPEQLKPKAPAPAQDTVNKPAKPVISGNGLTPEQNAELQARLKANGALPGGTFTGHESGATPEQIQREHDLAGGDEYH